MRQEFPTSRYIKGMPASTLGYAALEKREKQRRVAQLKEAARRIAGGEMEDMVQLLADAAGAANNTTRSIGVEVQRSIGDGTRVGECGRQDVMGLLQHVSKAGTAGEAASVGCKVGWRLWGASKCRKSVVKTVKKKKNDPRGRKPAADVAAIRAAWVERADHEGRIAQCLTHVAREISLQANCTQSQAERWRPSIVHAVRRASDLCTVCELLRSKRLLCMSCPDKPTEGSRYVRGVWEKSEARTLACDDVKTLESHERVLDLLKSIYREDERWCMQDPSNRLCIFDFAAAPKICGPIRGTDYEFHSKITVGYYGGMVLSTDGVVYHHVLDFGKQKHTANHTLSCVGKIMRSPEFLSGQSLGDINMRCWNDTASNFRSKEFIGSMLCSFETKSMRVSFHCEGHGKTALDGIFKTGKEAVRSIDAHRVDGPCDFATRVQKYLDASSTGPKHVVHYLTSDDMLGSVSLVVPAGVNVTTPYIWERKEWCIDFPYMHIDLGEERLSLETLDFLEDPPVVASSSLETFQQKKPKAAAIVDRIRTKSKVSALYKRCSVG